MAKWPGAIWQPVSQFSGTLRPIAVCLHHQAGTGNPAPIYASRGVSAHFWIPRAPGPGPVQHVDTANRAWHGVAHNDYSIGVETEGCGSPPHADPLTEYQLDQFGLLMAWAHQVHGIPLVLSEAVTTPGLNYHRCQGGPPTGCPCDVRVNARAEILRRAGGAATGGDDDLTDEQAQMLESIYNAIGVGETMKPRWDGPTWLYNAYKNAPTGLINQEYADLIMSIYNTLGVGNMQPRWDGPGWLVERIQAIEAKLDALGA